MKILDNLWDALPRPAFSDEEAEQLATRVYEYVWSKSRAGGLESAHTALQ